MKKTIYLVGLSMFLLSCQDARQKISDALDKEVMGVHDEVMPKMGKILEYKKQINQMIDSCETQACKDSLQKISYLLTRADEDMMQWMRTFEHPEGLDTAEAYLNAQKEAVLKVKAEVEEGLGAAEQLLGTK